MPNIAFLNGKFMPLSSARVPVEDRGFQFADGIYELILACRGQVLFLDKHLARMERNAGALGIDIRYDRSAWRRIITEAHRRSRFRYARVYVQLTRGVAPRDHAGPMRMRPTVLVTVRRHLPPPALLRKRGAFVITVEDIRWGRCDIKTINLLPNVLAKQQARAQKAFEAIFIWDGYVMEGATSNVFAVTGRKLVTPPNGPRLLSGVTRDLVIRLAKEAGMDVVDRQISLDALYGSEEVFLSGTTIDILPVVKVDGRRIGSGRPGVYTQKLYSRFLELIL